MEDFSQETAELLKSLAEKHNFVVMEDRSGSNRHDRQTDSQSKLTVEVSSVFP